MAPPPRKRLANSTSHSNGKRSAIAKHPVSSNKAAVSLSRTHPKNTATQSLSSLGFSATKRPKYQNGTKILLDDTIYNGKAPEEVRGYLFVYEIVDVSADDKMVTVEYKNQVIRQGGDRFRVYTDSEDPQVRNLSLID